MIPCRYNRAFVINTSTLVRQVAKIPRLLQIEKENRIKSFVLLKCHPL